MNEKLKGLHVEYLFQAVLCLETMEECYNFFEDLCTVPELKALSQRLQVAKCYMNTKFTVKLFRQPELVPLLLAVSIGR